MSTHLHPSGHVDGFSRAQLPPIEQWPVMLLDGVYHAPPRLNAAEELLDRAINEGHGHRVALVTPTHDGRWEETTYAQLATQVDALAHVLVNDLELVAGNRVLLRGFNGRFMTVAWLATVKAGLVAVTTMPMLRATELRVVIERAECCAALCDARLLDDLASAALDAPGLRAVRTWGGENVDRLELAMARYPRDRKSVV